MIFISPQKFFLFSRYSSFCLDFLVMYQNGVIKKTMLISNFMTSQLVKQTIVIHILPNFLRSKGNQTIKLGPLIEYNIFLEKLYPIHGEETSPRPFSEKLKLTISLGQWSKILYSVFLLHGKLWSIEIYCN